jgi:NADPH:quinone reductase-like Zn-dependent oxidoreductase
MKLKRVVGWSAIAISVALVVGALVAYFSSGNTCDDPNPAAPGNPMKAIVYCDFGTADVLKLENIEKPTPGEDEILVRVRAAAVNPLDWHTMRGTPYIIRIGSGLRKPKVTRLGVDYAGTIEAVGRNVTQFNPGDDVFGGRTGALAEYVSARADRAVVLKPANLTFEQAASVPIAAITALQGLRDAGKVQPGQKILINGASGGVGTFAVQIAKAFGADVTGVCSTRNVALVRSLGADHVIDYTKEDYTRGERRYDVIMDNVGNRSLLDNRRVLNPEGRFVLIGGGGPDNGRWIGPLAKPVRAAMLSWFVTQDMGMMLAELNKEDLAILSDLMETGKVTPVIDRRYSLSDVPAAIRYLEQGRARGKVVIVFE